MDSFEPKVGDKVRLYEVMPEDFRYDRDKDYDSANAEAEVWVHEAKVIRVSEAQIEVEYRTPRREALVQISYRRGVGHMGTPKPPFRSLQPYGRASAPFLSPALCTLSSDEITAKVQNKDLLRRRKSHLKRLVSHIPDENLMDDSSFNQTCAQLKGDL